MVGSMTKGICGSLVGTLDVGGSVGTKGVMKKISVMVVASGMHG
jgi:hypothetical protein